MSTVSRLSHPKVASNHQQGSSWTQWSRWFASLLPSPSQNKTFSLFLPVFRVPSVPVVPGLFQPLGTTICVDLEFFSHSTRLDSFRGVVFFFLFQLFQEFWEIPRIRKHCKKVHFPLEQLEHWNTAPTLATRAKFLHSSHLFLVIPYFNHVNGL